MYVFDWDKEQLQNIVVSTFQKKLFCFCHKTWFVNKSISAKTKLNKIMDSQDSQYYQRHTYHHN